MTVTHAAAVLPKIFHSQQAPLHSLVSLHSALHSLSAFTWSFTHCAVQDDLCISETAQVFSPTVCPPPESSVGLQHPHFYSQTAQGSLGFFYHPT